MRSGMYIVKAEADQIEKIVNMSIRAFETDVNVGGTKGDCPPGFDSIEEMPKYVVTYSKPRKLSAVQREAARTRLLQITHRNR